MLCYYLSEPNWLRSKFFTTSTPCCSLSHLPSVSVAQCYSEEMSKGSLALSPEKLKSFAIEIEWLGLTGLIRINLKRFFIFNPEKEVLIFQTSLKWFSSSDINLIFFENFKNFYVSKSCLKHRLLKKQVDTFGWILRLKFLDLTTLMFTLAFFLNWTH